MTAVVAIYTLAVFAAAGLAGVAIWSQRHLVPKAIALGLAAALMAIGYAGLTELLGRPKPAGIEWLAAAEEATVVGAHTREGEAIYLWLLLPGAAAPRAYVLPWSQQAATELKAAQEGAEVEGTEVHMRAPFKAAVEIQTAPRFYAPPQAAPPPKPRRTAG